MRKTGTRLLAVLLAVVMVLPSVLIPGMAAEATGFTDVPEGSWYADAVNYVSEKGYMTGVGDNRFAPNDEVTRAMFVTILARITMAETDGTASAFTDVPANKWYTGAVSWAAENGIVNGVGDGMFAPGKSITRQDLCTILYRFVNAMDYELTVGEEKTFTDGASVSSYAAEAVRYASSVGLIAGYDDGTFRPKATATRAQMAVIIMRLARLLDGQIVKPEPMPAQSFNGAAGDDMTVSVNAPEGALPENTKMTVSRVTDEAALAELASKVGAEVLGAADISFAKDGAELEPARKVSVRIALDAIQSAKNPAVVHVKDDGSFEYVSSSVVTTRGKADAIEFEADSFSVYAVVGGEGGSHTLTITFYARENGSTGDWKPINKQIIRQDQLLDDSNLNPIFDPGVPNISTTESFEGWYLGTENNGSYSESDTGVSVAEINAYYKANVPAADTTVHYYAMVYPVLYVVYHDQNGAVLMTESYHKNVSNEASVTINWPYVPFTEGYTFTGWTPNIVTKGENPTYSANPTVYQNGQSYTISATLNLYPYVQEGHWITFDNNLEQNNTKNGFDDPTTASYTAPVFAASGVNPTRPDNPERPGYTFGGWYDNPSLSGNQFNFNTPLTADTTLYAKWTPTTNGTSYMVVFWVQSVSDEVNTSDNQKEYDFGYSEIRTGTACNNAALTISNSGTDADNRRGYNDSSSYRSLVITFNQTNTISKNGWSSVKGTKPIRGDGGTVLNVYYDRRAITYIFADSYDQYYGYSNSRTYSGLYGQPFSEEAFPATGNQFWKCRELNATINRYINGFTFFDNTNSTYHFVPYTLTGLKNIYEKTQKLNADGTGVLDEYDLKYTYFVQSNGSSSIGSDTFPGFEGYKYNYQRDSLTNGANNFPSGTLTVNGSSITGNGAYLYFNRLAYDLDFNSNGTRVRHETVYFEAPLSRFADYVPDNGPRECFFDGWFSDQQLTQKHNLLTATMPNGTKTVFAKWTPKKYRVILNNVSPSDGVTAPSGAQASFLVNGGERIDKNALEGFTCNGKRLMGWYTDPEFKHPFNPESLIYDTVSDVNTYYGEKMPDETDAAYNVRMNGATRTGTDSITNTTWDDRWDTVDPDSYAVQRTVRSQLQLYALWRADPDGVVGMHVTYLGDNLPDTGYFDVTEPTVHPHTWKDPDLYSDHSWAYAQPASVPDRPDDRQFLYWEILDDEGQPTGRKVYPGQTFEILFDNAYQGTEPPTNCEHTERELVAAVEPTCETAGNSAHYRCTNCGRRFATNDPSDTTVINPTIPALGHSWTSQNYTWDSTVTPWTCTATATCSRNPAHTLSETVNGVWYVDTAPTGHSVGYGHYEASFTNTSVFTAQTSSTVEIPQLTEVTVSFVVPSGVTPVDSRSVEPGSTTSLPSAGAPSGYTFLGWVTTPMADTGTAPSSSSYMTAGSNYSVPNSDSTLYALYSYQVYDGEYELLTSAPADWSGNYVITAGSSAAYVMKNAPVGTNYSSSSSGGHAAFSSTGMTLSNNKLTNVADSYIFEVAPVTYNNRTYYTFKNQAANAWLNFSSSYILALQTTVDSGNYWSLSYDSNGVKMVSTNGNSSYFVAWYASNNYFASLNSFTNNYETKLWKEITSTHYVSASDPVTITFNVPSGVTAVSSISASSGWTTTLPNAQAPSGYTFVGWISGTQASETTTAPDYALTDYVVPDHDVTLNALYTRSDVYYQLLTSDPGSYSGDYVITSGNTSSAYMMGVSGTSVNRALISGTSGVTLSDSCLRGVPDANVFTFVSDGSGYRLRNKGNDYYVYSSNNSALTASSTNYKVFTVSYYSSNIYIYYSVSSGYYTNYYYMRYSNNAFSVSTNQSYLYLWQKHETLYYTTAPSVASGSILEPVQTVEPGQTEETAVLDLVSFTNPVREGEEQTEYNIFLRAVYGPYNPDATTHIYWYANNGTNAHNGAGERYTSEYTVTENGVTTTTNRLPINAKVDIPVPTANAASQTVFVGDNGGALTWEDHVFLGWARVDNGGTADAAQAQILTPDDIYLKWTGDHYEYRQADGTFSENWTMQQVYADETTPYHDMYAVWAGFYYVYHSSDGTLEAVEFTGTKQVDETTGKTTLVPATKNLVSMVRDGYIYGGYYKSYRGAQTIAGGETTMKSRINSEVLQNTGFWDYTNSKIADDAINYIDLTDDGAVHYNATTDKIELDGSLVRLWNKTDAYGKTETGDAWAAVKGSAMTPVVGKIYYLREVPNAYLPNVALAICDKKDESGHVTDQISKVYVLSASDELLYTTTQFSLAGETVKATVSKQFIVDYREPNQDGGYTPTTVTYTADKLRAGLNGKIGWVLSYEIPVANLKTGTGLVVKPSWTTYDGVTVYGDQFTYKITPDGKTLERNN